MLPAAVTADDRDLCARLERFLAPRLGDALRTIRVA